MRVIIAVAVIVTTLTALMASTVMAGGRDVSSLRFFADASPAGGVSNLDRDGDAGTVSAKINATHLTPGAAYSYWWVIFNLPGNCSAPGCGEDDLFLPDGSINAAQINAVHIAVLGGNGEVANKGGRAQLTGTLFEVSAAGHYVLIGPGGLIPFPYLLEGAMTAEIHIVVRNHGPAQTAADLAEQLTTFWGNCTNVPVDDDPTFECVDEQFAVHK